MGEINIDNDNAVELTELKIQLEAVEDKIIVIIDPYKSGYECSDCGGTGKIKSPVVIDATKECPSCNGKGALIVVPEIAKSLPTLGRVVSVGEKTRWAKYLICNSRRNLWWYKAYIWFRFGYSLTRFLDNEQKEVKIRPGAKVLFQPYVGTMIPFKGNLRLKIMREHEPLCVIYGTDIEAKNFMDFDVPLEDRH